MACRLLRMGCLLSPHPTLSPNARNTGIPRSLPRGGGEGGVRGAGSIITGKERRDWECFSLYLPCPILSQRAVAPMTDVTRILSAIEQGDPHAASELLPLIYDELRRLAAQKLAHEAPGQTLQATALVHEAYLRLDLDEVDITVEGLSDDILALDDALTKLAQRYPQKADLVKLRYFAGLTVAEAAKVLDISPSTADRHWTYARAWLYREVAGEDEV